MLSRGFGFFCECRGFCHRTESDLFLFIRPSSDGTYYGMVMSVRPTLRPGLRPPVFRTFLIHALTY